MKQLHAYRMRLVLVGFVAAVVFGGVSARADFTFGEPTNLGPTVNSSSHEIQACLSDDGLSLYFVSNRPGGYGLGDLWVATRPTTNDDWGQPANLGPTFNTLGWDEGPNISADCLSLYFNSDRPGGYGGHDIWVSTRATTSDPWGEPVNLGPNINSSGSEHDSQISADGLSLYFCSDRPGGYSGGDIWVARRATTDDGWGEPVNLGPMINSSSHRHGPGISPDGLLLFFTSSRPGGYGWCDLWFTTRKTIDDNWGTPVNLGPMVNNSSSSSCEHDPSLSANGRTLFFDSDRPGRLGGHDIWQAAIIPIVDLNGDGIVDSADMCIMVDHWGEDYSLCDIGPMPWGDGIVDVQDLIVLAEHLFEDYRLIAQWKLDEEAGEIAYDNVGEYDATLQGEPLWQPTGGMVGGALDFDGVDDYVSTPFVLNPGDVPFSVTAWIKGGAPDQVIVSQADTPGGRTVEPGSTWLGINSSDGTLMTGLSDIHFGPLESDLVVTDGQWHHIALVYDPTAMKRHLYVDGVEVAVDSDYVAGLSCDAGLYIGIGQALDAATFYSGLIDDVRIYNQALSAEEIAALAQ